MSEEQTQLESADYAQGQQVQAAPATTTPAIDPSLLQSVGALRGIAIAHNLLDTGLFPHSKAESIRMSMDFLRKMHEELKKSALAHPDADKVPELQDLKGAV